MIGRTEGCYVDERSTGHGRVVVLLPTVVTARRYNIKQNRTRFTDTEVRSTKFILTLLSDFTRWNQSNKQYYSVDWLNYRTKKAVQRI